MTNEVRTKMDRQKRLRRVALLCCHFIRNLAYYDAGRDEGHLVIPASEFNKTVNGNFIDICVLEWCKLLGDTKAPHHWEKIVKNKKEFKIGLLSYLETDSEKFVDYLTEVRAYRDKFIAHLDSDEIMQIPKMDWAYKSVLYYFGEIIEELQMESMHRGIPTDLNLYYLASLNEAKVVYNRET
jgi:hypothetical protein